MIKVIETIEGLESIREDWQVLMSEAQHVTPFQSIDYAYHAWLTMKPSKGSLHIVCIIRQNDKKLLGIFPWYIDNTKTLRFINDIHTDFCDGIVHKDVVGDYHFWKEVCEYVSHCKEIKSVRLINIPLISHLTSFFSYFLKPTFLFVNAEYSCVKINKLESGKTAIDAITSLNSKERARLKNVYRKNNASPIKVFNAMTGDEFPYKEVDFLVKQMINSGIRTETYFSSEMIAFFNSLFKTGLLQVHLTQKDSVPVAANLWLHRANDPEYIDWISLYIQKDKNLDNLLQSIEVIAQDGGTVNFARGTYPYKIHNFRPTIYSLLEINYSPKPHRSLINIGSASWFFLKKWIKFFILNK